jgi:hypothetical protein
MKKRNPIHWQSHEYEHWDRSPDWFWAVGIITVAAAATSIILGNVLFAVVLVLGGFTLSMFAQRKPKTLDIVVDETGVRVDNLFYPYRLLESFWIEDDGTPRLFLKSKKVIMPFLIFHISEEVDLQKLQDMLILQLPEEYHSETALEKLFERLGF